MSNFTYLILMEEDGVYGVLSNGKVQYYVEGVCYEKVVEPDEYQVLSEIDFP